MAMSVLGGCLRMCERQMRWGRRKPMRRMRSEFLVFFFERGVAEVKVKVKVKVKVRGVSHGEVKL